jgi:hypothetical protein
MEEGAMPMSIDINSMALVVVILSVVSFVCLYITRPQGDQC